MPFSGISTGFSSANTDVAIETATAVAKSSRIRSASNYLRRTAAHFIQLQAAASPKKSRLR
jgi:hypothetical protein